jgi:hypothetical protein
MNKEEIKEAILGKEDTPLCQFATFHPDMEMVEILLKGADIQKSFNRFMVKDYVKFVKGTDFPKFFTRDTTDEEFKNAMELFYKYRGELISGGLCFKELVDLKTYGDKTNEYRVFYIGNQVASISRNSLQPSYTPEPPLDMINKYKDLPSTFYTLDYAELDDGSWKILEAGDGSVSGPSDGQNLEAFYIQLCKALSASGENRRFTWSASILPAFLKA